MQTQDAQGGEPSSSRGLFNSVCAGRPTAAGASCSTPLPRPVRPAPAERTAGVSERAALRLGALPALLFAAAVAPLDCAPRAARRPRPAHPRRRRLPPRRRRQVGVVPGSCGAGSSRPTRRTGSAWAPTACWSRARGELVLIDTRPRRQARRARAPGQFGMDDPGALRLPDRLRAAGVAAGRRRATCCSRTSISTHCGWNTRREGGRLVPTFPTRSLLDRARRAGARARAERARPRQLPARELGSPCSRPRSWSSTTAQRPPEGRAGVRPVKAPGQRGPVHRHARRRGGGERGVFFRRPRPHASHVPWAWIMGLYDAYRCAHAREQAAVDPRARRRGPLDLCVFEHRRGRRASRAGGGIREERRGGGPLSRRAGSHRPEPAAPGRPGAVIRYGGAAAAGAAARRRFTPGSPERRAIGHGSRDGAEMGRGRSAEGRSRSGWCSRARRWSATSRCSRSSIRTRWTRRSRRRPRACCSRSARGGGDGRGAGGSWR